MRWNVAIHAPGLGTQSQADADLVGTAADRERHDTVQPNAGEEERGGAENREERSEQEKDPCGGRDRLIHRAQPVERQRGIDASDRFTGPGRECARLAARPDGEADEAGLRRLRDRHEELVGERLAAHGIGYFDDFDRAARAT